MGFESGLSLWKVGWGSKVSTQLKETEHPGGPFQSVQLHSSLSKPQFVSTVHWSAANRRQCKKL
jgi:hypothetical protein